jgi:antitoxin ParD1/3/4
MNKLTQPVPDDELFGPELSEAEMEAWIARNRDAINESLREARQEFAEGKTEPWNMEDVMAEVEEELRKEGR